MSKIVDVNSLNSIFELDDLEKPESELIDIEDEGFEIDIEDPKTEEDFVDTELKQLLKKSNEMMDAAKYLVTSTPDSEAIAAASSMINSISNIISEFNRAIIFNKRQKFQMDLEKLKFINREKLTKIKARAALQIKDSTINVQNNLIEGGRVPFSQEDIVKEIIKQKRLKN
jgi:hypothetical protein